MTREEKATIIDELKEKFRNHNYFYITDASGFSVKQVNEFRKACYDKGLEYKVVKNTLISKALDSLETDYSQFQDSVLKGFSGIVFSPESGNLPAKVIQDFRKKEGVQKPLLKGASIDTGLFFGNESLEVLANLKSKEELIGDIIALLQSPAKNVISALESGKHKLAGIVKTLSEKENN
jgi:large subunit ribosomal protein L10